MAEWPVLLVQQTEDGQVSKETKIEWADSTLNFWSGCTKVSAGCANCYAEGLSNRKLGNIGEWGKGAPRKRHQSAFNLAFQLNKKPWICDECGHEHVAAVAKDASEIIECRGCLVPVSIHRRRVFSLSLGDWLDPEVTIEWVAEMLDVIRQCDQLQWLLVTKRPELFASRLEAVCRHNENTHGDMAFWQWLVDWIDPKSTPPKHVMVLTSVENQQAAEERIPALLAIPGRHGLSCEPLLGPVNLVSKSTQRGAHYKTITGTEWMDGIDWVIVGGESGTDARPCAMDWIAEIQRQCAAAQVPVFVKQLGKLAVCENINSFDFPDEEKLAAYGQAFASARLMTLDPKGGEMAEWPEDFRVREFPKV